MVSDTVVVAAVLASILLFFIVFFTLIILYLMCCVTVTIDNKSHKIYDLVYRGASRQRRTAADRAPCDLEAQLAKYGDKKSANSGVSNIAIKSLTPLSVTEDGDLLIKRGPLGARAISEDTAQYHDAAQKFNESAGPHSSSERSISSTVQGKPASSSNWLEESGTAPRTLMLEDSETISRTTMLMNLIDESLRREQCISRVADPYADNFVSIGGIVVVVKPFHGDNDEEFKYLQPGDLLRVVMFYVNEQYDENSTTSSSKHGEFLTQDGKIVHDKTSVSYQHIYCKGVLLSTFLEYNQEKKFLGLKLRSSNDDQTQRVSSLLKSFPLNIVSLETTVLRTMSEAKST